MQHLELCRLKGYQQIHIPNKAETAGFLQFTMTDRFTIACIMPNIAFKPRIFFQPSLPSFQHITIPSIRAGACMSMDCFDTSANFIQNSGGEQVKQDLNLLANIPKSHCEQKTLTPGFDCFVDSEKLILPNFNKAINKTVQKLPEST